MVEMVAANLSADGAATTSLMATTCLRAVRTTAVRVVLAAPLSANGTGALRGVAASHFHLLRNGIHGE